MFDLDRIFGIWGRAHVFSGKLLKKKDKMSQKKHVILRITLTKWRIKKTIESHHGFEDKLCKL